MTNRIGSYSPLLYERKSIRTIAQLVERLSAHVRAVQKDLNELKDGIRGDLGSIREEVHETRELLAEIQSDLRIHKRAMVNQIRRVDALEAP